MPGPMGSFHSARKTSSYLVRDKITVSFRNMSFFKFWGMRFQFSLNVTKTEIFPSTLTNQTYKINQNLNVINVRLFNY